MFNSPSLADIAAVTDRNNNNGGFSDGNGWWVLIILFALFGGWGNGNWNNGGNGCCNKGETTIVTVPTPAYGGMGMGYGFENASVQRGFDNQTVINKLDGINSGICSLGYDQLAQMNGINSNIMQTGFGIQQAINADTVANMQNTNALQAQLSDCCCENRAAIAQVRYDMATDTCALKTEVHQTGDAIIQNQNAGFNMLNQTIQNGFNEMERQSTNRYIAELERKLNACDRDSALQGMATYVINSVRPMPQPSYSVPNPWGCGCNQNGCCGSAMGCCA